MLAALLLALQGPQPLAVRVDALRPDQDILDYQIAVAIPDSGNVIHGRTRITYLVTGGAGPLRLDFDTTFTVDSVWLTRGGRTMPAQRSGWTLAPSGELSVSHWGRPGDTLAVTIVYHGAPHDGLFIQPNVHGERSAFADNWPNRAHHWFPSEDHPSDKATASITIDVPAGWRAVANGRLIGEDKLPGGRTRWRWREERRIPVYTMVLGAGHLAVSPVPGTAMPSAVWTFAEDSAFAVNGPFARAGLIVRAFTRLVGAFPYEKLAHVESSTRFGGMENSSAIFYDEKAYAKRTMTEGVVAHETAHQWFGDAVTEGDWHHLWLSEGFASYFEPLFYEAMGENDRFRERLEAERQTYLASRDVNRPVIDTAQHDLFALLNRNNYQKGALILHMLRTEVGDSAFFRGLRAYYATFRDSTALTSDFAAVMEKASGRSLQQFFDEWLLQPGYPRLQLTSQCDSGSNTLTVAIEQVQPAEWGAWSFALPAEIGGSAVTIPLTGRHTTFRHAGCGTVVLDPRKDFLLEVVPPAH